MFLVTVALLLGVNLVHAQGGVSATFKPTIEQKVDARSSPAQVTGEAESALTSKGYVKIGTINASQPGASAEVKQQLESSILKKAAEAGGDVIRFSKEGTLETADVPTGKMKRTMGTCVEYRSQAVSTTTSSHSCSTDIHGFTNCTTWNTPGMSTRSSCVRWSGGGEVPVTRREKSLVSEGTVWRYDPMLAADIAARAEEVERETARKAARAAEAVRQDTNLKTVLLAGDLTRNNALLNADPGLIARRDERGETPLHWAAKSNSMDVAELLISKGADVNAEDKYGNTPLFVAAKSNSRDVVELLIAKGINVNAEDKYGNTPLLVAAQSKSKDVAELLIAKGVNVNAEDKYGNTPLFRAAESNSKDVAELLIAKGADVNGAHKFGKDTKPLYVAVQYNYKDVAELLIDKGAYLWSKDTVLIDCLWEAAKSNSKDVAELLIDKGADVNARDNNQYAHNVTPLLVAVKSKSKDVAKLLIAKGADVNAKDEYGDTPLFEAAYYNELDIAELLVAKGADVNTKSSGHTPMSWAVANKNQALIDLLRQHGGHK
jgi:ankyrin repeat protein